MWFLATIMSSSAFGGDDPATSESDGQTIDCSVHEDPACEAASSRLGAIDEALAALDCSKGRKKKREQCRADQTLLELERAELVTEWAPPPPAAPPAATRGVKREAPAPIDMEAEEEPVEGMEIDVSDE